MSTLYWLTVLGNISILAEVCFGMFFGMFAVFCLVSSFEFFDDDCSKSNKKTFKINLIGLLVSFALCILIPSKNELYAIYGVGSVIDYAKSSKEAQKLPDNAVKALNVYLDKYTKK